jgi:hypothetical protein
MQKLGLEWLYRVLQEPGRLWKRYLVTNTLFVGLLVRELFAPTPRYAAPESRDHVLEPAVRRASAPEDLVRARKAGVRR